MSSKTIDQRVVEMRFDNQQFERGVSTSMSTLDKLKKALNFSGATKGLDDVSAAAKGVNFTPLSNAVESVQRGFSTLEVIGVTALANITNSAVNAGKQLVKSLTVDQVTAGWEKLSQKTTSVATLVAQGYSMDIVEEQLARLNWFTDETSYNFTDMVENISKFTATGKGLEESVTAMEGIANWAALSGQNASTASRAMYQLSQAMGAGVMRMEDYKSIQNVSMDTDEFRQKALDAAVALGTLKKNADGTYESLINNQGAFTKSQFAQHLTQDAWFTSDVMMKVFNDYSSAVDQIYEYAEEKGITASQAIKELGGSVDEFGLKAFLAAQEAKTFGDAIDATKDAVSTGWMNTFELIFGNYEEQRVLWTDLANAMYDVFASGAEARNELLSAWGELGGRDLLVESFWNTWNAIFGTIEDDGTEVVGVITAIKDAFRAIFPETTAQNLYDLTEKLRDLTEKFKMTDETANNLKNTFKGFFAILSIGKQGITAILKGLSPLGKALFGLSGDMLNFTGSVGEWLTGLDEAIKSGEGLAKVTEFISGAISKVIGFIESLAGGMNSAGEATDKLGDSISGAQKALSDFGAKSKILRFLTEVGAALGTMASRLGSLVGKGFGKLKELFDAVDLDRVAELVDTLSFGALSVGIVKFINYLRKPLEELGSFKESVLGVIDAVSGRFSAMEKEINARSLLTIAGAIGILAVSLLLISTIDEKQLGLALGGITTLIIELVAAFGVLGKIDKLKGMGSLVVFSTALFILAAALKKLSTLSNDQLITGMSGLIGTILILYAALSKLPKDSASMGGGLILLALGLQGVAVALKILGSIPFENMIGALVGLAGTLIVLAFGFEHLPKDLPKIGASMLIAAVALNILALALRSFGSISDETMVKGMVAMGGALLILASSVKAMTGTISGAAALIVASAALAIMAPALWMIGSMPIASIGKALLVLAGSFTILGIAGALLTPVVPVIIGLAGAIALVGLGVLGIGVGLLAAGAGLSALAAGLTALAAIGATTAASIAASITTIGLAIISLIPLVIAKLGEGIVAFWTAIGNGAVAIGDAFKKIVVVIVDVILTTLVEYTPRMIDLLFDFLIGVLNGLAARMPEFLESVMNVVGALFRSIGDAIRAIDAETMLQDLGIIALITGLIVGLSLIGPMIPGAMVALLGVAAFIVELSLVLAAMGAINQIPGLGWLIGEGGKLLQNVGAAIGGFVGGIVGGFMEGVSSQFPKIGTNLSEFMKNVTPFIEGASAIDPSMLAGARALTEVILLLTAASVLDGIASFINGGSSLEEFADQIVPFGRSIKRFSEEIAGMDDNAVKNAALAGEALTEMAASIPNTGGLAAFFAGENDLNEFAEKLVPFGRSIKAFGQEVSGINTKVVKDAALAGKAIAEMAAELPNSGGVVGFFAGENDMDEFAEQLILFGTAMKNFASAVFGLKADVVTNSVLAGKALVELADTVPNSGGVISWFVGNNDLDDFGEQLYTFGYALSKYSVSMSTVNTSVLEKSASAGKLLAEFAGMIPKTSGLFTKSGGLADFGEQLSDFGEYLSSYYAYVKDMDQTVLSAITAEVQNLTNSIINLADIDSENMANLGAALKNLGTGAVESFADGFTKNGKKIDDAGYDMMNRLIRAVESKKGSIKTSFSNMIADVIKSVRNTYSDFKDAGKYLVQGFSEGISANTYLAEAKAKAMAAAAANAAKAELDINSPSRVGEEIGNFFGLGFVNAIDAYQKYAYESAAGMAESAESGLTAAATKIQNAIDGNLDTQPVIRPVLDLSSIQAGSQYLNGLIPDGGIQTIRGAELSSRISTDFGGERSVNPKIQNAAPVQDSSTTNTFNIYGTNAQEIAQEVSKILSRQVQRRERAWA